MLQDLPKWERPREKLAARGPSALSNAELIAILISSGTNDESAISLASRVLALEPGGLSKLSGYEPEEFMTVKGIGLAKACTLVAAMELGRRISACPAADKIDINDDRNFANLFMDDMRYLNREIVRIVMLDIHNKVIGKTDVSIGGIADASAHPREVFAPAIKKAAAAIIVAHNHPSGESSPSKNDLNATKQLAKSGKILGIELMDHLVIGDGSYTSIRSDHPEIFA